MAETLSMCDDDILIQQLLQLRPMELLGKYRYTEDPEQLLRPVRSPGELEQLFHLAKQYGIDLESGMPGDLRQRPVFSEVVTENHSIHELLDISADLHPRYIGNAPHCHDYYELVYVCCGSVSQRLGADALQMTAGDLCILCPGASHDILAVCDDDLVLTIRMRRTVFDQAFFQTFSEDEMLQGYFREILYGRTAAPYLLLHTGEDREIRHICLNMYRETVHVRNYSRACLNVQACMLFIRLLRDHGDQMVIGNQCDLFQNAAAFQILQYIRTHADRVTLEMVAQEFHYHPAYLSRTFRRVFGYSFAELRAEFRMTKAKELLRSTTLPCAEMVGYQSASHFFRLFQKRFGVSPQTCRGQQGDRESKV